MCMCLRLPVVCPLWHTIATTHMCMCLRSKVMLPMLCLPGHLPRVSLEWSEVKELVPRSVSTAGPLTVTRIWTGPEQHLRTAS